MRCHDSSFYRFLGVSFTRPFCLIEFRTDVHPFGLWSGDPGCPRPHTGRTTTGTATLYGTTPLTWMSWLNHPPDWLPEQSGTFSNTSSHSDSQVTAREVLCAAPAKDTSSHHLYELAVSSVSVAATNFQ